MDQPHFVVDDDAIEASFAAQEKCCTLLWLTRPCGHGARAVARAAADKERREAIETAGAAAELASESDETAKVDPVVVEQEQAAAAAAAAAGERSPFAALWR